MIYNFQCKKLFANLPLDQTKRQKLYKMNN